MSLRILAIAGLFTLAAGIALTQQIPLHEVPKIPSPVTPRNEKIIVARVGPLTISAQEFLLNYEFGPAFPKREKNSKERYLNYMIYEKLLALDAEAQGLEKTPEAKRLLAAISGDLVTEELYRDAVAPRVKVSQTMIARGVERDRKHISVQWLYTRSERDIARIWNTLASGGSFDTLFSRQLSDSVAVDDRMMETTRFKLGMVNPVLSTVADTLPFGHVSPPIHTPDGWYVVRLTDGWSNAIVTETDEMKSREDVERALVQHLSDSLSDHFVDSLLKSRGPEIRRRSLDLLAASLAKAIVPPDSFASWGITERLRSRWHIGEVGRLDAYKNDVLVKMKQGSYRIDDFLEWYGTRETYIKLPLNNPERFYGAAEKLVWRMVRDRTLTSLAMKRGLQNRVTVRNQKEWWKQKVAYSLGKAALAESIHVSDDSLHSYYETHLTEYRDDKGSVKKFEEVKEDVRTAVADAELTKKMLHKLMALKAKYGVDIPTEALRKLEVDTENQPRAIDVYAVKKGGIFPHRAFPAIDYEWQAWE